MKIKSKVLLFALALLTTEYSYGSESPTDQEFGEKIVEGHGAAAESTGAPSADLADQPLSPLCRQPIAPPKEFFRASDLYPSILPIEKKRWVNVGVSYHF